MDAALGVGKEAAVVAPVGLDRVCDRCGTVRGQPRETLIPFGRLAHWKFSSNAWPVNAIR